MNAQTTETVISHWDDKFTNSKVDNLIPTYLFPNVKIGIVIPAFNESKNIKNLLYKIPYNISNKLDVIVIDDGSHDDTAKIAEINGAIVLKHYKNMGYGAAVRSGFEFCLKHNYDIIVNLDSDGQHEPVDIEKFIRPIYEKKADFVLGNRYGQNYITKNPYKKIFSKLMSVIYSILFKKRIYDPTNGFRAFSRKLLKREQFISNYTVTQEILFKIIPKYKIEQVSTKVYPRLHGNSFIRFDKYLKKTIIAFYRFYIIENFSFLKKSKFRPFFERLGLLLLKP